MIMIYNSTFKTNRGNTLQAELINIEIWYSLLYRVNTNTILTFTFINLT